MMVPSREVPMIGAWIQAMAAELRRDPRACLVDVTRFKQDVTVERQPSGLVWLPKHA